MSRTSGNVQWRVQFSACKWSKYRSLNVLKNLSVEMMSPMDRINLSFIYLQIGLLSSEMFVKLLLALLLLLLLLLVFSVLKWLFLVVVLVLSLLVLFLVLSILLLVVVFRMRSAVFCCGTRLRLNGRGFLLHGSVCLLPVFASICREEELDALPFACKCLSYCLR